MKIKDKFTNHWLVLLRVFTLVLHQTKKNPSPFPHLQTLSIPHTRHILHPHHPIVNGLGFMMKMKGKRKPNCTSQAQEPIWYLIRGHPSHRNQLLLHVWLESNGERESSSLFGSPGNKREEKDGFYNRLRQHLSLHLLHPQPQHPRHYAVEWCWGRRGWRERL